MGQYRSWCSPPHWMDLEDAVTVPWMAEFTRNPVPERVVGCKTTYPTDLDQAVVVKSEDGQELHSGVFSRTIANLARTLVGRAEPALMFNAGRHLATQTGLRWQRSPRR